MVRVSWVMVVVPVVMPVSLSESKKGCNNEIFHFIIIIFYLMSKIEIKINRFEIIF